MSNETLELQRLVTELRVEVAELRAHRRSSDDRYRAVTHDVQDAHVQIRELRGSVQDRFDQVDAKLEHVDGKLAELSTALAESKQDRQRLHSEVEKQNASLQELLSLSRDQVALTKATTAIGRIAVGVVAFVAAVLGALKAWAEFRKP